MAGAKEGRKVKMSEGGHMGEGVEASDVLVVFYFLTWVLVTCYFLCSKILSSVFRLCAFL